MPQLKATRISDKTIRSAKPKTSRYEIRDAALQGFMLRVSPSGTKAFYVQLERGVKRKIGNAAIMSLTRARRLALEMLQRHEAGERIESRLDKHPSFEDFVTGTYLNWATQNQKTGQANINRLLKACAPLLDTQLDQLTEIQIERWKMTRLKAGLSPSTVRRDLAELKASLSRAMKWGYAPDNPAKGVTVKVEQHHRIRYLTDTERTNLLKALSVRDESKREKRESGNRFRQERKYDLKPEVQTYSDYLTPMVLLAMHTGMRRSELFSLTWENLKLKGTPQLTVLAAHAKSGKTRHIPLNKIAVDVLQTWAGQNTQSGLVFPKPDGTPLKSIKTAWGKLISDAKIKDFRFHDLRHDFASRLVMNGVDLYRVKELLGHGSIEITQRYAHLAPHTLAEAVEVLV
jgi:site-specific recombinase XerD